MSNPTTTSAGLSIADLKALVARDLAASNDLQTRIEQLRTDIAAGKKLPAKKIDLMESSNKDMTRDLVRRIEQIEGVEALTPTDREMLQALNARLVVCDVQAMRLAELRELEREARGDTNEFLEAEELPRRSKPKPAAQPLMEPVTTPLPSASNESTSKADVEEAKIEDENNSTPAPTHPSDEHAAEDSEHNEENDEEPEEDRSKWPKLYQILDVDPNTLNNDIAPAANSALKRLAMRHNPKFLPNDPYAPSRWNAITKAHAVLTDPGKRQFYDSHDNVPADLVDFDISRLAIS